MITKLVNLMRQDLKETGIAWDEVQLPAVNRLQQRHHVDRHVFAQAI